MSPTSYHCSTPRYSSLLYAGKRTRQRHKNCINRPWRCAAMANCGKGSTFGKWGAIAVGIAGGALISLIPIIKKRAMRVTTILKKDHRMVSGLIATLQMAPKVNGIVRKTLFDQIHRSLL